MKREFHTIDALLNYLKNPVGENTDGFYQIDTVSAMLAARIKAVTGEEISGWGLIADCSSVAHTLRKHGISRAISEIAQGQIPITDADFIELAQWLSTPEYIMNGLLRPGKQPCVEFQCELPSGKVTAVLEFRPGRKRLALVTMYKKRPTT